MAATMDLRRGSTAMSPVRDRIESPLCPSVVNPLLIINNKITLRRIVARASPFSREPSVSGRSRRASHAIRGIPRRRILRPEDL